MAIVRSGTPASAPEEVVEKTGHRRQYEVCDKPRNRFARTLEDHDPDRREQRPEHDAARSDVAADAQLHHEGHEQEERNLGKAEKCEVARLEVMKQTHCGYHLVAERNADREPDAHRPVDEQPDHRGEGHQTAGKDE
jgi:hypothetical protein